MADDKKDSKAQLAELMYSDEEMRPLMDKWAEEKFPGTQARMATAQAAAAARTEIAKEREAFRVEIAQERARTERQKNIDQIKRDPQLRVQDHEVEAIEKLMTERGIGTYEDAAALYRARNTVAPPESSSYSGAIEIAGLHGGGGKDGEWLSSAFRKGGGIQRPDLEYVDKLTKNRVKTILDDFKRDPIGATSRWGG